MGFCVYTIKFIEHYMATRRYEISLLMLKKYFTSEINEIFFQHEKRKFVSLHSRVISSMAWRTLLVYTAKNLTSFGSYELIKTQIASIFGKKLKFINSFSLNIFFVAVRPK